MSVLVYFLNQSLFTFILKVIFSALWWLWWRSRKLGFISWWIPPPLGFIDGAVKVLITRGWCLSDPCLSSSVCHRFCDCSRPLLCLCGHRGNVSLLYDRGPSSLLSFWCWSIILVWQTCILPPAGVWLNSVKIWGRPDVGIRSSSSLLLANFVIAKSSEKRPNMDDNSFPDCLHMNSSTTSSAAVGFLSNLSRLFRSDDVFPSSHSFYFSLSPLSSLSVSLSLSLLHFPQRKQSSH